LFVLFSGLKANFTDTLTTSQFVDSSKSADNRSLGQSSANSSRSFEDNDYALTFSNSHNVDWFVGDSYDLSAALPPPPAQMMEQNNDSDEDFPLPPPPDLNSIPAVSAEVKNETPSFGNSLLMHSLTMKLASRNSAPTRAPPPVAAKTFRASHIDRSASCDQGNNVPPMTADESDFPSASDNSLLAQIQRGMSLRRAVSNDRSGPCMPSKN